MGQDGPRKAFSDSKARGPCAPRTQVGEDSMTPQDRRAVWEEITRLVAEHRDRCLWFLAPDFLPTDDESAMRALRYIERYGGKAAFEQARSLRTWLQQHSSANSAV